MLRKDEWVLCPICRSKTRIKIRPNTVLENFPLFCPKCKQETLISVKELHTSVIKEPDAEPMILWDNSQIIECRVSEKAYR